jgi:phage-related protein
MYMKISTYQTPSGRSPIEDYISGLSKKDQARFYEVYEGIKKYGLDCPGVIFKHLEGKLWEIKFSSEGGRYRIAYVLIDKEWMYWLHVFRKTTQKTPKNDFELALKRLKEVQA